MMGKLLKYEFISTCKNFLLMYLLLVLIAVGSFVGGTLGSEHILLWASSAMGIAVMPVVVVYFGVVERRFSRGLYGNEAYLIFTLPVKGWEIVLSKWLIACFWGVVTLFVGMVSGFIMIMSIGYSGGYDVSMWSQLKLAMEQFGWENIIRLVLFTVSIGVNLVAIVYASISVANLPYITKFNGVIAVVLVFLLVKIENIAANRIFSGVQSLDHLINISSGGLIDIGIISLLAMSVVLIGIVIVILSKKVSLK